ncbi:MAG: polysaccharide deacetylase family protein, partial [Methanomicrobiales archaeon]|nr:polysaccharide deacetylase family protein [Methanomicrobiales archaeon]
VTSGYVGSEQEFWWDDLERLLLLPDHLLDHLDLTINGEVRHWNLSNEKGNTTGFEHGMQEKKWNVLMNSDPGPQYGLYRDLHRLLKPLPSNQQDAILTTLARWAGLPKTGRKTHRPLTLEELKRLDKGDVVEIGAHTVTHPSLSMQPYEIQKEEILKGKQSLEKILNHPVHSFSYPFGGPGDFNAETVSAVKSAGLPIACVNYGSTLIKSTDAYRLPRVLLRDWNRELFSSKIKEWFNE